jgi:hypothetical protein
MEAHAHAGGAAAPTLLSRNAIVAAIVALLVGGAIATSVWWLTDNDVDILPASEPATHVIVADTPVQPSAGVAAKDEAGLAAAIGGQKQQDAQAGSTGTRYDGGPEEGAAQAATTP